MNEEQAAYLTRYLATLPVEQRAEHCNVSADYFCTDEKNANICADLILKGEKTASCSMKYWYESGLEPMPKVGTLQVVTNWDGKPTSITQITDVWECKFSEVSAEFAASEGEGDRSLAWWREAHWDFFSAECQEQGLEPSTEMMLVLERFQVVYS